VVDRETHIRIETLSEILMKGWGHLEAIQRNEIVFDFSGIK
jgi:hypothetical protein